MDFLVILLRKNHDSNLSKIGLQEDNSFRTLRSKQHNMKPLALIFVFFAVFILHSCVKDSVHPVPTVPVDFLISVDSPQFVELNSVHGWASFSGGVSGIIIFRRSIDEFAAFDQACPHHPFDRCGRITRVDSPIASCGCCNSNFLLFDGSVISGPSRFPLKQYRTSFQHPWLRVTSW